MISNNSEWYIVMMVVFLCHVGFPIEDDEGGLGWLAVLWTHAVVNVYCWLPPCSVQNTRVAQWIRWLALFGAPGVTWSQHQATGRRPTRELSHSPESSTAVSAVDDQNPPVSTVIKHS